MSDQSSESSSSSDESAPSPEPDNQSKSAPSSETSEPKTKSSLPNAGLMAAEAVQELSVHGAMSLKAVKKFVISKYGPISETQSRNINKYIKNALTDGSLVQPKGKKGIQASFKVPSAAVLAAQRKAAQTVPDAESEPPAKSSKTSSKKLSPSKKKASKTEPKESTADLKKKSKTSMKTGPKSPLAKKIAKSPTSKPKSPKPKKVTTASKSSKAAAKIAVTVEL